MSVTTVWAYDAGQMFTRIQTRGFRCLKSIDQRLGAFRALIGPNATGKTIFLDVIGLLSDLMRNRGEVWETVQPRSSNFQELLWMGNGHAFQLAIEAEIPVSIRQAMAQDKRFQDKLDDRKTIARSNARST